MIVGTMSLDEIAQELKKDKAFLGHQQQDFLKKDLKILRAKKLKEFPYYFFHEVVSNRKNRYLMRFEIESERELKDGYGIYCTCIAIHEKPEKGLYAYFPTEYYDHVVEYKAHFFHRYAERNAVKGSPIEVIRHYFKNNPDEMMTTGILGDTTYMVVATMDGVAFGLIDNGHRVNRTFVTYELLFRDQKKFQEDMVALIRLNNLHHAYRFDKDTVDQIRQKINVEDYERVGLKLWRAFARYSLDLDVSVRYNGRGEYLLAEKGVGEKAFPDKPKEEKVTHLSAVVDFMINNQKQQSFAELPVGPAKKKNKKRVTPATIFRRKKK